MAPGIAPSRLRIGDQPTGLGGTKSSLRSEPDTHSANNIIQKYLPGSVIEILDGPYCSYGILLWMVSTTQDEWVTWLKATRASF